MHCLLHRQKQFPQKCRALPLYLCILRPEIEVGRGKLSIEGFRKVIEQQDRGKAGTSAPGNALFLVNVEYPESIFESNK